MRVLDIPEFALVVMVGASGSGKSTLARRLFRATEILSSDGLRGIISDDEGDQSATADAFRALYYLLHKRLARKRLTVVDATSVRAADRTRLIAIARKYGASAVALVVDPPERVCLERNAARRERRVDPAVIRHQIDELHRGLGNLERGEFSAVYFVDPDEELAIRRVP